VLTYLEHVLIHSGILHSAPSNHINIFSMLCVSPRYGASSGSGWRRRLQNEDSCEYIEQAIVDSPQGVALKSRSFTLWRCVVLWQDTNVSDVHAASIFRVKIQDEIFWVVTQCSVVAGYQRFGCPWCLRNFCILPQHYTASQPKCHEQKHHCRESLRARLQS
jgi:hypothetical protein